MAKFFFNGGGVPHYGTSIPGRLVWACAGDGAPRGGWACGGGGRSPRVGGRAGVGPAPRGGPHKGGGTAARRHARAQATTGPRQRGGPRTAEHGGPHTPRGRRPRRDGPGRGAVRGWVRTAAPVRGWERRARGACAGVFLVKPRGNYLHARLLQNSHGYCNQGWRTEITPAILCWGGWLPHQAFTIVHTPVYNCNHGWLHP